MVWWQARVVGILGGIDETMLQRGRYSHRFFTVCTKLWHMRS
jgi:hypothetical protein